MCIYTHIYIYIFICTRIHIDAWVPFLYIYAWLPWGQCYKRPGERREAEERASGLRDECRRLKKDADHGHGIPRVSKELPHRSLHPDNATWAPRGRNRPLMAWSLMGPIGLGRFPLPRL